MAPSPSQGTHGAVSSTLQVSHGASTLHGQTILLKVINPAKKRKYKVFQIDVLTSVDSEKELRKVIFDKIGKNIVPFDLNFEVGYYEGNTRMSFSRNDEFTEKLCQVAKEGRYLWCYGNKEEAEEESDAPPVAKRKKAVNSVELKAETVDAIANELKKHGDEYTKMQCTLWEEVFVNKKHTSLEEPPLGSIWKQPQDRVKIPRQGTEAMTMAFTKPTSDGTSCTPTKHVHSSVSPGKRIDLQG